MFDTYTFSSANDGDGSSSCRRRWRLRSTATAVEGTEADASALPVVGVPTAENHTPVLLQEVLHFFRGSQLRTFVDGTLGAGGHSAAIACQHSVGLCCQAQSRKSQRGTGRAIHLRII